jgi:hypothetical protein
MILKFGRYQEARRNDETFKNVTDHKLQDPIYKHHGDMEPQFEEGATGPSLGKIHAPRLRSPDYKKLKY